MWKILIFLSIISISFGNPIEKSESNVVAAVESSTSSKEDQISTIEPIASTSASSPSSSSSPASPSPSTPSEIDPVPSTRPKITYDQRQEGKYNIRADLENFVIVVIPSSPSNGMSLLDLLTRSNKSQQKKSNSKHGHKKYHHPSAASSTTTGTINNNSGLETTKQIDGQQNYLKKNFEQRQPQQQQQQSNNRAGAGGVISIGLEEQFIEGRTPYHVDISSTELLQSPTGTTGPSSSSSSSVASSVPSYNKKGISDDNMVSVLPRNSKSLFGSTSNNVDNLINTNSVLLLTTSSNDEYINSDNEYEYINNNNNKNYNINTNNNHELINLNDYENKHSFDSLINQDQAGDEDDLVDGDDDDIVDSSHTSDNNNNNSKTNEYPIYGYPKFNNNDNKNNGKNGDGWELTLLGAEEQCGPDRRRDSYGVCQFISY